MIERLKNAQKNFEEKHPNCAYALNVTGKLFTLTMSSVVAYMLIGEMVSDKSTVSAPEYNMVNNDVTNEIQ